MFKWFHHIFNPHCPECSVCSSCEILKHQLEIANIEKMKLLDSIIKVPEPVEMKEEVQVTLPKMIPWRVRQQMLEAEDRKKAQVTKNLEDELGVNDASQERETVSSDADDRAQSA